MIAGIAFGLVFPVYNDFFMSILKPVLMLMMFLVFLKIDLIKILQEIRQFKLMLYLVLMFLFIIPAAIYNFVKIFDENLALGLLLLTTMPAAISSSALTDLIKGNIALSASITVLTSLIAPFSVPLVFSLLTTNQNVNINYLEMFQTIFLLIFIPMLLSQIAKRFFLETINKIKPTFSALNVLALFILVYATIGSQKEFIINNPLEIIQKIIILYVVFIILHIMGYLLAFGRNKQDKIAITVSRAYMNNGMAVVLAASFFQPSILILMILSEIPWNTLLFPFQKALKHLK